MSGALPSDRAVAVPAEPEVSALRASIPSAQVHWLGGNCPVQAEGEVDGLSFYFRARGDEWQFHVAATQPDIFKNDLFYYEEEYGDGPYDAGWMPEDDARAFIAKAIRLFRAQRIEARSDETPQEARPEGQEPDPKGCAQ